MNSTLSYIPKRTEKPRQSGLNMVMDKGLSLRELLVKYDTKKLNTDKKKTKVQKAAKGGVVKMNYGGMAKKKK